MPAPAPPSCGSLAASVGTPITGPSMSTSAPPELPGLIGALVWIVFGGDAAAPLAAAAERRDDALRDARAQPERVADRHRDVADVQLRRVGEGRRRRRAPSSLITARSSAGNVPTSVPGGGPSAIVTSKVLAVPTTWALVTMCPWSSKTMPEPRPWSVSIWTTFGETRYDVDEPGLEGRHRIARGGSGGLSRRRRRRGRLLLVAPATGGEDQRHHEHRAGQAQPGHRMPPQAGAAAPGASARSASSAASTPRGSTSAWGSATRRRRAGTRCRGAPRAAGRSHANHRRAGPGSARCPRALRRVADRRVDLGLDVVA